MLINVTQEDIDNGIPANTRSCPVALAAKRDIPKALYVNVTTTHLIVTSEKRKWFFFTGYDKIAETIPLSKRVSRFVRNFDIGGKNDPYVKPFSFELEI